jgi:hypothetical protein
VSFRAFHRITRIQLGSVSPFACRFFASRVGMAFLRSGESTSISKTGDRGARRLQLFSMPPFEKVG